MVGSHFQPSVSSCTFHVVRGVTQLQLPEISCPRSAVLKGSNYFFHFTRSPHKICSYRKRKRENKNKIKMGMTFCSSLGQRNLDFWDVWGPRQRTRDNSSLVGFPITPTPSDTAQPAPGSSPFPTPPGSPGCCLQPPAAGRLLRIAGAGEVPSGYPLQPAHSPRRAFNCLLKDPHSLCPSLPDHPTVLAFIRPRGLT